eukprot:bmy_22427T0
MRVRSRSPEKPQSCDGELGRLLRATAEAQERAAGARHPQECGGGAEAQAGTANEEPGSSAGAGSGEFHVYRHLRRREYQRQDYMDAMAEKQKLDAEFQKRLEKNKIAAEEQTAKRRKKR